MSPTPTAEPLALGVYRFSDDGGRSAKGKLHTDATQRETIERIAKINGLRLVDILDERSISGDVPLEQRPYGEAIRRVESREIQPIIFAYRTRHDRSIVEGTKAIERMDRAGGVLLVGGSVLSHATPDKWAEATMGSFMGEWQKRQITYASHKGVARAVALGRVPYPSVGLGFILNHDQTLRLADERVLRIVREAFAMRASGATIDAVRGYLAEHGHRRSYQSIRRMLLSSLYVGEIRFGVHENLDPGFDPIVERDVWERVQTMSVAAGRQPKSERLLSRQKILVCDSCGGRMSIGTTTSATTGRKLSYYRCGRGRENDCTARAMIMADVIEPAVEKRARAILADAEVRESAIADALAARDDADDVQAQLDAAQDRFLRLPPGANTERAEALIDELARDLDAKLALAKEIEDDCEEWELFNAARDWDDLVLDERRRLICAAIRSVRVSPGGDSLARCKITSKRKTSSRRAA